MMINLLEDYHIYRPTDQKPWVCTTSKQEEKKEKRKKTEKKEETDGEGVKTVQDEACKKWKVDQHHL